MKTAHTILFVVAALYITTAYSMPSNYPQAPRTFSIKSLIRRKTSTEYFYEELTQTYLKSLRTMIRRSYNYYTSYNDLFLLQSSSLTKEISFTWEPFTIPEGYIASLTLTCKNHAYDKVCSINGRVDFEKPIHTIEPLLDTTSGQYTWVPQSVDSRYRNADGLIVVFDIIKKDISTIVDRTKIYFDV